MTEKLAIVAENVAVRMCPTPEELAWFYLLGKQQRLSSKGEMTLWDAFFQEKKKDILEFMVWAMDPEATIMGVYDLESGQMMGLGRMGPLYRFNNFSKGELGIIFLREYQDRKKTIPACTMMMDLLFERIAVDVVYTTIPEKNRASLLFMRSFGFEYLKEPIPYYTVWNGEQCGAVVGWMTRERWNTR